MTSTQTISIIRKALIACGVIQESTELHQVQDHYATYIQRMYSDCSTNLPKTVHDLPEGELKVKALEILEETKNEVNVQTFVGTALTSPEPESEPTTAPEPEPEPQTEEPTTAPETESEVAPEAVVINLPETLEFLEGEDLEIDIRAGQEFNYASGDAIAEGTEITVEVNAFDADIEINQTETGHFVVSGLTADHDGANLVAHVNVGGLTESHTFTLELVE